MDVSKVNSLWRGHHRVESGKFCAESLLNTRMIFVDGSA